MSFFEKILYALDAQMETPNNYGWFHLIFLAVVIFSTIFLCVRYRNASPKIFKIIMLISWILIVFLEVYKQLNFSLNVNDGVAYWDYQWYAFPFQFCSSQLYILPFIIFNKEGCVKDSAMAFMMTFSLFGGLVVMAYPNDVFIETIGINLQTMIHHGLQVVLGIYLFVYNRHKNNFKFFLKGTFVFVIMVVIAMILNLLAPSITNETFNMFYISPYFDCTLPLVSVVYKALAERFYVLFLLIYILCFILASFILYLLMWAIKRLSCGKN